MSLKSLLNKLLYCRFIILIIKIRSDSTIVAPYERWQYHHPSTFSMPLQVEPRSHISFNFYHINLVTFVFASELLEHNSIWWRNWNIIGTAFFIMLKF